jgi:dihydrofolate reductase
MSRPRFSVFIAASLDGYIAARDGSIAFLDAVQRPGEDYGFARFFDGVDTLVMGRRTYDTALGFDPWPYAGKRCVVLTHAAPPARHGEEFFAGEPSALASRLGDHGARHIYVDGGAVISTFLTAGLIDDLTISVIPVLLGDGVPLFAHGGVEQRLVLTSSRGYESGLVQLQYAVRR